MGDSTIEWEQIQKASLGGEAQINEILAKHRDRLSRMVRVRLDARMQGRIDPSDVIQEAYFEASRRIDEYIQDPSVPFFVWLRFLTLQKLAHVHRQHFGVKARDVSREVSIYQGPMPQATSAAIAAHLVGQLTSPSQAAMKAEMKIRIQMALNDMEEIDCEIIALRHYEQLTQKEIATILGISEKAAGMRHMRALARLRKILKPKA